jgi:hypothetical protein
MQSRDTKTSNDVCNYSCKLIVRESIVYDYNVM